MRPRTVLAAAALIAAAAPSTAVAGVGDGPDAIRGSASVDLKTTGQTGTDAVATVNEIFKVCLADGPSCVPDPTIACELDAAGGPVTEEANYVVGKVPAADRGAGHASCTASVTSFSVSATTKIQSFEDGTWVDVPGCNSAAKSVDARGPVTLAVRTASCAYDEPSAYLDEYHRALTVVTNSVDTRVREFASPVWYMQRG